MKNLNHHIIWTSSAGYYELSLHFRGDMQCVEDVIELLEINGIHISSQNPAKIVIEMMKYLESTGQRYKEAIRTVVDLLQGRYSLLLVNNKMNAKAYFVTNEMPVFIGLSHGSFVISDSCSYVMSHTDQIIDMDDEVIAEMYADGTCFFIADGGHRLNKQYLQILDRERSRSADAQIIDLLQEDFKGAFFNALKGDSLLSGINLS